MQKLSLAAMALLLVTNRQVTSAPETLLLAQSDASPAVSTEAEHADLVTARREVQIRREIAGDLAVAGGRVDVDAPVGGYVLAAGREVAVLAEVGNDLWAAGRTVTVEAPVRDNAWLAGQSVTLTPQGSVAENAYLAGSRVDVRGRVGRDLNVAGADVQLASEVVGTVHAKAGRLQVLPGAVIGGDLVVESPRAPEIASGARVVGQIRHEGAQEHRGSAVWSWLARWGWMFMALFVLGAAVFAVDGRSVARVSERLASRTGASLVMGLIGVLIVPLAVMVLAVTVIGIPLAVVLGALFVVALALAGVIVAHRVGALLMSRAGARRSVYLRLALGALAVTFLAALPVVGWAVRFFIVIAGVGALLLVAREWAASEPAEQPA